MLTGLFAFGYVNAFIYRDYGKSTDPLFYFNLIDGASANLYAGLHYILWQNQEYIQTVFTVIQTQHDVRNKLCQGRIWSDKRVFYGTSKWIQYRPSKVQDN
jgi:hypothetical protein